MTPQERAAAPVEVRQALANKVKNLIVSNLTHKENQLWLANVDAFEERAYQRGRRAALLECAKVVKAYISARDIAYATDEDQDAGEWRKTYRAYTEAADALDRLAQEG